MYTGSSTRHLYSGRLLNFHTIHQFITGKDLRQIGSQSGPVAQPARVSRSSRAWLALSKFDSLSVYRIQTMKGGNQSPAVASWADACSPGLVMWIPGTRVRLSRRALTATNSELPAMVIAAISGRSSSPKEG